MISLKVWFPLVQFLRTSPVTPIYLSVEYYPAMNLFQLTDWLLISIKSKCLVKSFHFINQSSGWILNNGALDFSLFYSDGLYLVAKGNLKLGKSILKAINSNSSANPYKNSVCFNLNKCDFPPLPSAATRCEPIYSAAKCVGPVRFLITMF